MDLPIVIQAGMGSGIATASLAAAVTDAGGLGTIGFLPPAVMAQELAVARAMTSGTLAVNVIVPLALRAHWRVAAEADVLVTHWDRKPKRRTAGCWIATVGSPEAARASVAAGADALIVQGVESGGHVIGTRPALEALAAVRAVVPAGFPVFVAGGIASRADVLVAVDAGAAGAVAGTRFVASEESGAHAAYKQRILDADATVLTELFGMGWPRAPHRVLENDATRRWLAHGSRGPRGLRALHSAFGHLARHTPAAAQRRLAPRPSAGPFDLTPAAPTSTMSAKTIETHPLYAGETVARVHDIRPAAQIVRDLLP